MRQDTPELRAVRVTVSRTVGHKTSRKSYPQCEFQRAGYMRHLGRAPCKTARQGGVVALRDRLAGHLSSSFDGVTLFRDRAMFRIALPRKYPRRPRRYLFTG
jgi:hypothetical protein